MASQQPNNIYAAPGAQLESPQGTQVNPADVLQVATAQKGVLWIILLSLVSAGIAAAGRSAGNVPTDSAVVSMMLGLFRLALLVATIVYLYRMARPLYNLGVAIVFCVLSIVPLLNLILLIVANQRAIKMLREHGFKVGLMGTDLNAVRAWVKEPAQP